MESPAMPEADDIASSARIFQSRRVVCSGKAGRMILSASFLLHFRSLVFTLGELLFEGKDLRDGVEGMLLA